MAKKKDKKAKELAPVATKEAVTATDVYKRQVDEDQYQTKRDEQEAKHDELQDGPDKCVEQAEEESGSEQSQNHSLGLKVNSRQQQRHQTQGHAIGNDLDEHETPVELEFSNIGHGSIMDWAGGALYHRNGVNMV